MYIMQYIKHRFHHLDGIVGNIEVMGDHDVFFGVRMNIRIPSYTAQPIAELKTFRDRRRVEPSKNPEAPRFWKVISEMLRSKAMRVDIPARLSRPSA